jgi:hypothetical protein
MDCTYPKESLIITFPCNTLWNAVPITSESSSAYLKSGASVYVSGVLAWLLDILIAQAVANKYHASTPETQTDYPDLILTFPSN